jgi:hypothetical protein
MAMLNESNLLAMKARAAKFRTHHVGTKLNEAELHEFEALAEKRKQSPSELIRGRAGGCCLGPLPCQTKKHAAYGSGLRGDTSPQNGSCTAT